LEISLRAGGIGPGDEVIVPAYTFLSTASSVLQIGAIPIFVDIDSDTYNIDPVCIEKAITKKTKAIIPLHFLSLTVNFIRPLAAHRFIKLDPKSFSLCFF